ncbi:MULTISPECIES: hypothetical protein [Dickeya]|uniref:Uncharacterized protein n=1 Tax=Dickeya aquatica TaxID=1401087 RepID=A0A375A9L6_9GAMM|nr:MULTISPECIES: hypothetical protein [Dickeya]SLM62687.1 hypothetical protein DAQ1742_01749 [Dickeya aquatica]
MPDKSVTDCSNLVFSVTARRQRGEKNAQDAPHFEASAPLSLPENLAFRPRFREKINPVENITQHLLNKPCDNNTGLILFIFSAPK